MAVLMIRAGAHPSEPPRTIVVLESMVAEYLANHLGAHRERPRH